MEWMILPLSAIERALGLSGAGPYAYGPTTPAPDGLRRGTATGAGFRGGLLTGLFSLAVLLPNIAVQVRRLHNPDRSGWWLLPVVAYLIGIDASSPARRQGRSGWRGSVRPP